MKKLLSSILVIVLVLTFSVTLLVACQDEPEDLTPHTHHYVNGKCDYKYPDGTVCNKADPDAKKEDTRTESKVITFYTSMSDELEGKAQLAVDRFEAKYPGWTVEFVKPGGYDDVRKKVVEDIQGSNQPDLAYCYPDHVAIYIPSKKVVDMSKYIYSTEAITGREITEEEDGTIISGSVSEYTIGFTADEIADIIPGFFAEGFAENFSDYHSSGYSDDTIFTLPFQRSTELLFYNKTALTYLQNLAKTDARFQPGGKYENVVFKVPETWDELWAMCPAIREVFPGVTPLGYDSDANWFITMCAQNGWGYTTAEGAANERYLFNNANTITWLQSLKHYYELGYITTQGTFGTYTSGLFTQGVGNGVDGGDGGGLVFCIGSSAGASKQNPGTKFEADVAHIPGSVVTNDEGQKTINNSVISQGPSLVMFRSDKASNATEKEKMTFMFVKELLDPQLQANFATGGYLPVRNSTYEIPSYAEWLHPSRGEQTLEPRAVALTQTMAKDYFTSPAFNGSSSARDQVGAAVTAILKGASVETTLKDAVKACGGKV